MDYYQIEVHTSPEQAEIILAFLSQLPFDTFEERDQGLAAYIPVQEYSSEVEQQLRALQAQWQFEWQKTQIPSQNWNARWEAAFQPIVVDAFCAIRADFHPAIPEVKHEIIINPKMAFGTGHHETTFMVLQMMETLHFPGKSVLDFGCGTGVLAILAAQLGATTVDAIDNDVLAYENTLDNLRVNATEGVHVFHGTLEMLQDRTYDLLLANINRNVILQYFPTLYSMLSPGGQLVVSGFLEQDRDLLLQAAQQHGFQDPVLQQRNHWLCLRLDRNN